MKRIFQHRELNRIWESPNFYILIPKAILTSPLYLHFENFILTRLIRSRIQDESRRTWLLSMGISWLAGLVPLAVIAVVSHYSSYLGVWTWMWSEARAIEPASWIFLLGDARFGSLLLCGLVGALPAYLTGYGGWMWLLAPVALFPGVLSLPGAWTLIFAERLALWIRFLFVTRDRYALQDLRWRAGLAGVFLFGLMSTAPVLRDLLSIVLPFAGLHPDIRFIEFATGLALYAAGETLVALTVLHFYFLLVKDEKTTEIWSLRLNRWPSISDRYLLKDLRQTAERRLSELRKHEAGLDPETAKNIPPAVLRQMREQIAELARLGLRSDSNELEDNKISKR